MSPVTFIIKNGQVRTTSIVNDMECDAITIILDGRFSFATPYLVAFYWRVLTAAIMLNSIVNVVNAVIKLPETNNKLRGKDPKMVDGQ